MFYDINTSGLYYKSIMIVTYNCNGSGLHCETMILANLDLTRNVNYDFKVHCKLKHTLQ